MNLNDGTESEWIKFAELPIVSGQIGVSDPMYCIDLPPCPRFDLAPDVYDVYVRVMSWPNDRRISRLRVTRVIEARLGNMLADVGVDFAQAGVFDPQLIEAGYESMSDEQSQFVIDTFDSGQDWAVAHIDDLTQAMMPFARSGFGDGSYPIFELQHLGQRVGIEVVFIGPESDYRVAQ